MVPIACVEAASATLSASVSGPQHQRAPDVSSGLITGSTASSRGVGGGGREWGEAGDGGMRWRESGRQGGREGMGLH